jgi:hypothetical protein
MRKLIVVLSAAALVLAFTLPVMAQSEWSFYGNSRMWLEWADYDKEAPSNPGLSGFDDEELTWTLQSNSRIGANVAAGDIGGRFEYGTGVNLRLLYGTWNFGAGTILAGQDYTPVQWVVSSQCGLGGGDCGFIGWGTYYTGRVPQIKLSMGGFRGLDRYGLPDQPAFGRFGHERLDFVRPHGWNGTNGWTYHKCGR